MRAVLLTLVLLLVTGCVTGNPTAANPQVATYPRLDVRVDPGGSADVLLNPVPLDGGLFPSGMIVTIEVLPGPGWEIDEDGWKGPVFGIAGDTAKIKMISTQDIVIRMRPAVMPQAGRPAPMATSADTPIPPTDAAVPQPTYTPLSTSTDTELSHYSKGEAYSRENKYEQAISEFTDAVRLDPGFAAAFESRCVAYLNLADKMRALDDCNKAILLNPNECCAHYIRAIIYGDLGQHQKAIEDFDQAIRINPLYAAAYEGRGESYRRLGQYTKADADHAKACSLDRVLC